MTKKQILKAAMTLDLDDRIDIADELIASASPKRADIDKAWADEAERRIDAINRGEAKKIAGLAVFKELRAKYAK